MENSENTEKKLRLMEKNTSTILFQKELIKLKINLNFLLFLLQVIPIQKIRMDIPKMKLLVDINYQSTNSVRLSQFLKMHT